MHGKLDKLVVSRESKCRFKKQSLKAKNVLFENDHVQLATKVLPFYDFYTSSYYVQLQVFVGNKTDRKLSGFVLAYRGTNNLELFI